MPSAFCHPMRACTSEMILQKGVQHRKGSDRTQNWGELKTASGGRDRATAQGRRKRGPEVGMTFGKMRLHTLAGVLITCSVPPAYTFSGQIMVARTPIHPAAPLGRREFIRSLNRDPPTGTAAAHLCAARILGSSYHASTNRGPPSVLRRGSGPVYASGGDVARTSKPNEDEEGAGVAFVFPIFIISAIINRIMYRVQLVPMRDYTYFLSQFSCCCYVIVYGLILLRRVRANIVTKEMLTYARSNVRIFAAIGTLEALTFLLALYSAARIPGGLIGVLGQGGLLWSVILSRLFLGTRFDALQKCGVAVVTVGVLACTYPQAVASGAILAAATVEVWKNAGLYSVAMALTAGAVILKQKALQEANLDVIVVSAFGSMAQFLATLALLPITLSLATSLPPAQYLREGCAAFLGASSSVMP